MVPCNKFHLSDNSPLPSAAGPFHNPALLKASALLAPSQQRGGSLGRCQPVLTGFPSGCSALPLFPISPNSCLFSFFTAGLQKSPAAKGSGGERRVCAHRGVTVRAHQFRCMYLFGSLFAPILGHGPGRGKAAHPKFGCSLQPAADGLPALLRRWVGASPVPRSEVFCF